MCKPRKNFSGLKLDKPINSVSAEELTTEKLSVRSDIQILHIANKYEENEIDKARCTLLNECTYVKADKEVHYSKDFVSALYLCPYCTSLRLFDRFTDPLPEAIVLPRSKS